MASPSAQVSQPIARPAQQVAGRVRPILRLVLMSVLLWLLWTAVSIWLISPETIGESVGDAAPFDVIAPVDLVYASDIETNTAREAAAETVADIYTAPDPEINAQRQEKLAQIERYITALRNDQYLQQERRVQLLIEIPLLELDREQANLLGGANALSAASWQEVQLETLRLLEIGQRQPVRVASLKDSRNALSLQASDVLSAEQTALAVYLAGQLLAPNSFLDQEATEAARQAARDAIVPVEVRIRQGEFIIRQGMAISPIVYEKLGQLGYLDRDVDWRSVAHSALQSAMLISVLSVYLYRVRGGLVPHPRRQILLFLIMALLAVTLPWSVRGHTLLPYLYPTAGATMLVALFLGIDLASFVAVVAAIIMGLASGGSMEAMIYTLLGGLAGALAIWKTDQLSHFVRTGLLVALVNILILVGFSFNDPAPDTRGMVQLVGAALMNGVLSASLAFIAYSFTGRLFGVTTAYQLMELARPDHPLFRQLLTKAPGTYHHSIVVSNMAERAAEAIGADALLARVGSYYHDIGKITRPYYFVENQTDGENPHDRLDPYTSADIITSHTVDGVELGRKYHLPEGVLDFMTEHHGTTLVSYFYRQATQAEGSEVDESAFRYSGPKPRSRETAIVMLADSVEAWTRAARPASAAELERGIRQIISSRLVSGQLDDCDLTLKDLDTIREAFVSVLRGVYHPRIQYPAREASANGRSST